MKDAAHSGGFSKFLAALLLLSVFFCFVRGDNVLRHARAAVATVNEILN